jgi:2-succinyl-6-hydroxy-2,4-cyclohexadiene-1-carboxylate synthase
LPAESLHVRVNGLDIRVQRQGSGEPLFLLHGFTGSSGTWSPVLPDLVRDHHILAIDLVGHGKSAAPADNARYAFCAAVDDLAAVAEELDVQRASWLGYSLGGRLALGVAIRHPQRVAALVLESATAGVRDETERTRRRASDNALASRIEQSGIESFVAEWEALPMWSSQRSLAPNVLAALRQRRLANNPVGLANSLRGMGQGAQPSLWDRLGEVRATTLLIAGAQDPKFARIAAEMQESIPDAELAIVPDAGHAVHLERPAHFSEIVCAFLARRQPDATAFVEEASP